MIFQDPDTSLNPRMTTKESISEPLMLRGGLTGGEIEEVSMLMDRVGLSPEHLGRRPISSAAAKTRGQFLPVFWPQTPSS